MAGAEWLWRGRLGRACVAIGTGVEILPIGLRIAATVLFVGMAPQTSIAQTMSVPGSFGVSDIGAATYNLPIVLPPGTAGMAPSLGLSYNNQSGNGILGVGWSLDGLPSVGRCPRTWTQDGVPGGINYDANDRFCFEGQRLVAISGSYGADGTEYRTEVDGFSRILSHGTAGTGPAWFEVRTKSGQVMEFGHTADSQILAQGKTTARSWALNKVSDSKSNYFTVTYVNDNANGQAYPSRIDYTGNTAASLTAYNSVQFVYATRPDISPQYQAGSLMQTGVRLTNVKTYAGSTLVADYRLAYQQSGATTRSRITSVVVCEGGGTCLPATTFAWQDTAVGFTTSSFATGNVFNSAGSILRVGPPNQVFGNVPDGPGLIALDLNGDGKTDFVQQYNNAGTLGFTTYLSNGDGTFTARTFSSGNAFDSMGSGRGPGLLAVDFDGDGKSDLVQQLKDGQSTLRFFLYRSNGDGTFTASVSPSGGEGFESMGAGAGPGLLAVDLNGDGKTDLIQQYQTPAGYLGLFTYLSNGDGTFTVGFQTGEGFNSTPNGPGLVPVDLNGDGKTDLIQQYLTPSGYLALFTYLSNGDGTFTVGYQNPQFAGFNSTANGPGLIPVDLNGDGKTDLIQQWNSNGFLYFFTYLSNGDGTFTTARQYFSASFNSTANGPGLILVDLNGDGKSDLIQQSNSNGTLNFITYISNGDGTFTVGSLNPGEGFDSTGAGTPGLIPVDLIGVGKTGLVQQLNGSSSLGFILYTPSAAFPDLLTTITGGLGQTTSITYAPLTSSAVYTKDTTAAYPTLDLSGPIYVASRVDTSNGVGGTYSSTYSYAGAKADLRGRGFLGFRQMQVTDPQTSIVKTSTYRQDFPYIAMIASATKAKGAQTLNQTTNTLQFLNASGAATLSAPSVTSAPYRVSVSQNVNSSFDLDGSAIPTSTTSFQYDAYNNATQVSVTTSDGYSKTTTNTYTNDVTNWFLGRLTASTVTSQAPQQLGQYCALPWGSSRAAAPSICSYIPAIEVHRGHGKNNHTIGSSRSPQ
jgi:hypothetical protein